MDDVVFEVNICPMQGDDFSAAHAGTKTDERKNVCAGILDLRENAFTLFFVEGGFLRRRCAASLQRDADRRLRNEVVVNGGVEDAAHGGQTAVRA